jgi:ferredoxin
MPPRPRLIAVVDAVRCTGCGWCVPTCHLQLLSLDTVRWKKTSTLRDADTCTGCGKCVAKCLFDAIEMQPRTAS